MSPGLDAVGSGCGPAGGCSRAGLRYCDRSRRKGAERRRPRSPHHASGTRALREEAPASSRQDRRQDGHQAQRRGGERALAARRGPRGHRTDALPHSRRAGDDPGRYHVILVGAKAPVAVFAYPGKPSLLYPPGSRKSITSLPRPATTHWMRSERLADSDRRLQESPASQRPTAPGYSHRRPYTGENRCHPVQSAAGAGDCRR